MLRKFKISIDGTEYLVEMEEIGGRAEEVSQPIEETVQSSQPATVVEQTPVAESSPFKDAEAMGSPMPGTILKIMVDIGEQVKQNQPLLILEAMKMENEIVASHDGTISAIHVTKGEMVDVGVPLVTINR